jgi:hypothetical protein
VIESESKWDLAMGVRRGCRDGIRVGVCPRQARIDGELLKERLGDDTSRCLVIDLEEKDLKR